MMKARGYATIVATVLLAFGCKSTPMGGDAGMGGGAGGGSFDCGAQTCDVATQFCLMQNCGLGNIETSCTPLPDPCSSDPSCACVESNCGCGDVGVCLVGQDGAITIQADLP